MTDGVVEGEENGGAPVGDEGGKDLTPTGGKAPAEQSGDKGDDKGGTGDFVPFYKELGEGWRDDIVKGLELGESEANTLNRYTSFDQFAKSFFEKDKKIRQGLASSGQLPENATDEQIKEWRDANGIPGDPTGYESTLEQGLVLGEEDRRVLEPIWQVAHQNNVKPEIMGSLHKAFFEARAAEEKRQEDQDGIDKQRAEQHLRDAWGPDYKANINAITGLISKLPQEEQEMLKAAVLPDGRRMFNSPVIAEFFAEISRDLNPTATLIPDSDNPMQTVEGEIAKIEKLMAEDEDAYWKDQKLQDRYEQLLAAKEKLSQGRAA